MKVMSKLYGTDLGDRMTLKLPGLLMPNDKDNFNTSHKSAPTKSINQLFLDLVLNIHFYIFSKP